MLINIMSYNTQHCMNYITREIDYDIIADTVTRCGADIIGLQEMRGKGRDSDYQAQTEILAERLGFYSYFAKALDVDGVNPYGNAVLSRFPIKAAETVAIPEPEKTTGNVYYEERCLLKCVIDIGKGLNVCAVHFGLTPEEQRNAVSTVLKSITDKHCVLMGDFNVTPDNAILTPIRERMYDTAEKFRAPLLSFPSDNPNVKIDYIFTSRDITVQSADIPAIVSSDHRPHTAVIDF